MMVQKYNNVTKRYTTRNQNFKSGLLYPRHQKDKLEMRRMSAFKPQEEIARNHCEIVDFNASLSTLPFFVNGISSSPTNIFGTA
jgi:hypothetical protein